MITLPADGKSAISKSRSRPTRGDSQRLAILESSISSFLNSRRRLARWVPLALRLVVFPLIVPLAASVAVAAECPGGNLILEARGQALGAQGDAQRALDGQLEREGSSPTVAAAVLSSQPEPFLVVDLGAAYTLNGFVLQADQNDFYSVEGSLDGERWFGFWRASPVGSGAGLKTRSARLPRPGDARFLRIRGQGGDRRYAVSEFQAYCQLPEVWPPARVTTSASGGWRLSETTLRAMKAAVALAGMLVFAFAALRPARHRQLRKRILIGLGLLAALCWWNLGTFNQGRYLHIWESYHYFLGAKYFDELGYTQLYACTTVADLEEGLESAVAGRKIRNLSTNTIETTDSVRRNPAVCKASFTPQRWEAFRHDVGWFRGQTSPAYWARVQQDHGYNATPLWTAIGGTLARMVGPASDRTIMGLAWIDPLLLLAMWVCIYRTFGLEATAAAVLWWGTNQAADFSWIGGAFLRQGWLVLTIFGLCAVRTRRCTLGGFLLAWATLMRIFPGFLIAAWVLQWLYTTVRQRRLAVDADERRFAVGCLTALVLLGGLSVAASGGNAWQGFADNTRLHLSSHGTNTIGLSPVLAYDHDSRLEVSGDPSLDDPFEAWNAARDQTRASRRPIAVIALLGFAALLVWAVRHQPPWIVLILGIGLIPFTSAQSCYYYSILLGYGLLVTDSADSGPDRAPGPARPLLGALLCGLAVVSQLLAMTFEGPVVMDQRFTALSAAVLAAVAWVTVRVGREPLSMN